MTTGKGLDVIGLGPSAISQLDGAYAQNHKATADWQKAAAEDFATERGLRLSDDDRLRRELMQQLYGHGVIDKRSLEQRFGVAFDDYFADELKRLHELIDEGIAEHDGEAVRLTELLGRLRCAWPPRCSTATCRRTPSARALCKQSQRSV